VIGAGAAGPVAALFAASRGAETILIERTRDGGRKILISGGGRCNILPARLDERRFVTDSSVHTLRRLVRSWTLDQQIAFFEREVGIPLVEEADSAKLFPRSQRARDVRDGLLNLAARRGVRFLPGVLVVGLEPHPARGWRVLCDGGPALEAERVVVATGGLSVPNTGSDGRGLAVLARLGHTLHPSYPALTPVTAPPGHFDRLAGISLSVDVTAESDGRRAMANGGFLFTHRGYSGPAVLDVSHVIVRAGAEGRPAGLRVRWGKLPPAQWETALAPGRGRTVVSAVRSLLPERLAALLVERAGLEPGRPLAQVRREERSALLELLTRCPLPWAGDEGYRKAEVTGGGVSLAEVHPATLESRRHPGLFLCGELLDAFGPIGGYNFYWAWATGRLAGIGASA
jgi:predicted Rossmann fold flavoprotein